MLFPAADVVGRVVNWAFILACGVLLAPQDYGLLALVVALEQLFSVLLLGGLERGAMRFLSDPSISLSLRRVFITWAMVLAVMAAGAGLALGVFGAEVFTRYGLTDTNLLFFALAILLIAAMRLLSVNARASDRAVEFVWIRAAVPLLKSALFAVLVMWGQQVVFAYLLAAVLASFGAVIFAAGALYWGRSRASADTSLEPLGRLALLRYSLPFLPHMLAGILLGVADRFLLEYFLSATEVGIYTFAYTLGSALSFVYGVVAVNYERYLFASASEPARAGELQNHYLCLLNCLAYICLLVLSSAMVLFTEYLPPSSEPLFDIVLWIYFGYVVNTLYLKAGYALAAARKTRYIPMVTFGSLLLNVGLNCLLIPRFGVLGAAMATFVSYQLLSGVLALVAQRMTGLPSLDRAGVLFTLLAWFSLSLGLWFESLLLPYLVVVALGLTVYCWSSFQVVLLGLDRGRAQSP